jgi:Cof subfamily protein (haloacid dehalogenase superfamily)
MKDESVNSSFRFIATDLDGTLRAEQQPFSPRVIQAIKQSKLRGIRVVMATGRMFLTAEPFARELGLRDAIVCDNGATIRAFPSGEILYQKTIPLDLAREIAALRPDGATLMICWNGSFYTPHVTEDALRFVAQYRNLLHEIPDLDSPIGEPQKMLFISDPASTPRIFAQVCEKFGDRAQVVQSSVRYVEMTNAQVSKGKSIEWLANRWSIPCDRVIAIGDQDNDRSMVEWAGLGVAMGNAVASLKACADFIAPTAAEDGVALVIEKFVLGQT